jgi:hypothetical protein
LAACLIAAIFLVGIIAFRRSADRHVPDIIQRQVTANPVSDSVYTAAISEDGKEIAYADLRGIHIRVVDTGEVRHVSLPPGFCFR